MSQASKRAAAMATRTAPRYARASATSRERRVGSAAWLLAPALLSGCSLIVDTEQPQCKKETDCVGHFGANAPFLCVDTFCTRPHCETSADCRAHGANFATAICRDDKLCDRAQCVANEDCGVGAICNPTTNLCEPRQCNSNDECHEKSAYNSPLVTCNAGRCEDKKWGCLGKPDDRPQPTAETATLEVPVVDFLTNKPAPGVTGKVCGLATQSSECTTSIAGETTYNIGNGILSYTGLSNDTTYRYIITPPIKENMGILSQYLLIDFYTQKPVRGTTSIPPITLFSVDLISALSQSFDPPVTVPLDSAGATVLIFDCEGNTADHTKLSLRAEDVAGRDTRITYFTDMAQPSPKAVETARSGLASIINLRPNLAVEFNIEVAEGYKRSDGNWFRFPAYAVKPLGSRLTHVHLHPRNYVK